VPGPVPSLQPAITIPTIETVRKERNPRTENTPRSCKKGETSTGSTRTADAAK
jgi:hypothetical protein